MATIPEIINFLETRSVVAYMQCVEWCVDMKCHGDEIREGGREGGREEGWRKGGREKEGEGGRRRREGTRCRSCTSYTTCVRVHVHVDNVLN